VPRKITHFEIIRNQDGDPQESSDCGLLVPWGIIRTDVSVSALTWFIRYRPAVENQKIKCNEPMGYTPMSYVIGKRNNGTLRIMMP
jgi:hypothetical protein